MIGQTIRSQNSSYKFVKKITEGYRKNADVYLCIDDTGQKFVAKHFYGLHPVANDGRGKNNHFGRRRDGSWRVFEEVQEKNKVYSFLVKHIERINHEGKWVIILEYIDGTTMLDFINENYQSNMPQVLDAVKELGATLAEWHNNHFALGDPHLGNALVHFNIDKTVAVKLIDYSQIHHPDFHYCKVYECFEPLNKRLDEDLVRNDDMLGYGFKSDLIGLDNKFGFDNLLKNTFLDKYNSCLLSHKEI